MDLLKQHTTKLDKTDDLLMHAEVTSHKVTLISTCSCEIFVDEISTGGISDLLHEIESDKVDVPHVLSLVLSMTTEADSFITSLSLDSEEGELTRKINLLHFQLLLKFKFINAVIRQVCPFFSASSTPHQPVIYPLNFLPTYFEVIDSYVTKLKSTKTWLSSDNLTMDKVSWGFMNIFSKSASKGCS